MTIPALPPLPLEWREVERHWLPYQAFVKDWSVASVYKSGGYYYATAQHWPIDTSIRRATPSGKYRSLDKAKAAAEAAAQAEWQRFVNSIYGL